MSKIIFILGVIFTFAVAHGMHETCADQPTLKCKPTSVNEDF